MEADGGQTKEESRKSKEESTRRFQLVPGGEHVLFRESCTPEVEPMAGLPLGCMGMAVHHGWASWRR